MPSGVPCAARCGCSFLWLGGRRDHALLLLAIQTGLRLSEITGLGLRDLTLERPAHVLAHYKGRKGRAVTLTHELSPCCAHGSKNAKASPTIQCSTPAKPTPQSRHRRGRAAVRSEWRLQAAVHNLLKLHNHWIAPAIT
jgi:integrase